MTPSFTTPALLSATASGTATARAHEPELPALPVWEHAGDATTAAAIPAVTVPTAHAEDRRPESRQRLAPPEGVPPQSRHDRVSDLAGHRASAVRQRHARAHPRRLLRRDRIGPDARHPSDRRARQAHGLSLRRLARAVRLSRRRSPPPPARAADGTNRRAPQHDLRPARHAAVDPADGYVDRSRSHAAARLADRRHRLRADRRDSIASTAAATSTRASAAATTWCARASPPARSSASIPRTPASRPSAVRARSISCSTWAACVAATSRRLDDQHIILLPDDGASRVMRCRVGVEATILGTVDLELRSMQTVAHEPTRDAAREVPEQPSPASVRRHRRSQRRPGRLRPHGARTRSASASAKRRR